MQIGDKVIVVERIAIEQRGDRGKKIRKKNIVPGNGAAKKETQSDEPPQVEPSPAEPATAIPIAETATVYPVSSENALPQPSPIMETEPSTVEQAFEHLLQEHMKLFLEFHKQKAIVGRLEARFENIIEIGRPVLSDAWIQDQIRSLQQQIDAQKEQTIQISLQEELRKTKATLTDLEVYVTEQNKLYEEHLEALALQFADLKGRPIAENISGLEFIRHSIAKLKDDFNHHHHQVQHGLFSSKAIV